MMKTLNKTSLIADESTRRYFLGRGALGLGACAIAFLSAKESRSADVSKNPDSQPVNPARAKRVISLFQSGGPSQQDLFDPKPLTGKYDGRDIRELTSGLGRLTGMTKDQQSFPVVASPYRFQRHGQTGMMMSELLPCISGISDEICLINSMRTEAINHDPAMNCLFTGTGLRGHPSVGAWVTYGLGAMQRNLPDFVVMTSRGSGRPSCQPLHQRYWGSGFLPGNYAGTQFRPGSEPVNFLSPPPGIDAAVQSAMLETLHSINRRQAMRNGDPGIFERLANYELAARMQTSIPGLVDLSDEPESVLKMYGDLVKVPGSYAWNCLMARRLAERDVRFIQLIHTGWDQHFHLPDQLPGQCADTDQASAALVMDLKQRGLLDDTLVVWGGEFGRTTYCQGAIRAGDFGRDHHASNFSIWMAGGGIRPGLTYGRSNDLSTGIDENPVSVADLHATQMELLGLGGDGPIWPHQGRDQTLTNGMGQPIRDIIS